MAKHQTVGRAVVEKWIEKNNDFEGDREGLLQGLASLEEIDRTLKTELAVVKDLLSKRTAAKKSLKKAFDRVRSQKKKSKKKSSDQRAKPVSVAQDVPAAVEPPVEAATPSKPPKKSSRSKS